MVRAAFFDLDKTILDTSSNVALSGPFIEAGLMNRRTAVASVLVQLPYLLAGADESRMDRMAQALGRMGRLLRTGTRSHRGAQAGGRHRRHRVGVGRAGGAPHRADAGS